MFRTDIRSLDTVFTATDICRTSIMRLVIPVVLYEITNVKYLYSSNTTIFIGRI